MEIAQTVMFMNVRRIRSRQRERRGEGDGGRGDWGRGKLWLQCARNATAILQSGEGSSTHRIRNALTWPGLGGFGLLWLPNQGRIEVCAALALTFLEPLL